MKIHSNGKCLYYINKSDAYAIIFGVYNNFVVAINSEYFKGHEQL